MSIQIASLFATIGADTSGLEKGLQSTRRGLESVKQGFGSFMTGMNQALEVAQKVGQAVSVAYGAIKEGAALDTAKVKFDRLSTSIGAASNLMLRDLRTATRGLVTDADLMTSASDFMSLGFAKNSDEVVRLTTVAGALGMNMNQLVLTLANQTTMRFDQLGIAVDGFDEKVKKLEKTGMSTSDAFQEAFLQQAEEQIGKVGNVADTSAGKIQQMETVVGNFSNTVKLNLAEAALSAESEISALVDTLSLMKVDGDDFLGIGSAIESTMSDITLLGLQFAVIKGTLSKFSDGSIDATKQWSYLNHAFLGTEQSIPQLQNDLAELNGTTKEFGMMVFNQSKDFSEYSSTLNSVGFSAGRLNEQAFNLAKGITGVGERAVDTGLQLYDTIDNVALANGAYSDLYLALFDASDSYEQFESLVVGSGMAFGQVTEAAYNLAKGMDGVGVAAEGSTRINGVSYATARGELAETQTKVSDLKQAYEDLDAAKLGFQGDIIQKVVMELETKFEEGGISKEQFLQALTNVDNQFGTTYSMKYELEIGLKEGIDDLVKTLLTDPKSFADKVVKITADFEDLNSDVRDAKDKVRELELQLLKLQRTYTANVRVNITTAGTTTGTNYSDNWVDKTPRAVGGPVQTNSPYLVGERGPELFVPSGAGYVMTNAQTTNIVSGTMQTNSPYLANTRDSEPFEPLGSSYVTTNTQPDYAGLEQIVSRIPTARDIAMAVRDALLLAAT